MSKQQATNTKRRSDTEPDDTEGQTATTDREGACLTARRRSMRSISRAKLGD
jgi:hypothetical protein